MTYRIEWKPSALREFKKLPRDIRDSVRRHVEGLAEEPRPAGCRKLARFDNAYRVRIGAYRLIYEVHDVRILVYILRIRPRSESYRDD